MKTLRYGTKAQVNAILSALWVRSWFLKNPKPWVRKIIPTELISTTKQWRVYSSRGKSTTRNQARSVKIVWSKERDKRSVEGKDETKAIRIKNYNKASVILSKTLL